MKMVDVSEILRLREMLKDFGIRHEYFEDDYLGGGTIKIPNVTVWEEDKFPSMSVIQHRGSFGGPEGKLEIWARPGMKDPEGWLSADEAFVAIQQWRAENDAP